MLVFVYCLLLVTFAVGFVLNCLLCFVVYAYVIVLFVKRLLSLCLSVCLFIDCFICDVFGFDYVWVVFLWLIVCFWCAVGYWLWLLCLLACGMSLLGCLLLVCFSYVWFNCIWFLLRVLLWFWMFGIVSCLCLFACLLVWLFVLLLGGCFMLGCCLFWVWCFNVWRLAIV